MKVEATRADAYQLLHDGSLALARAEQYGIRVDVEYCERTKYRLTRKINALEAKLRDSELYARWRRRFRQNTNIRSRDQLSKVLYEDYGYEPPKLTGTGKGATDEEALRLMQDKVPEIEWFLEIAKLIKIRDTYIEGFLQNQYAGIMHPTFNLHTVRTYRSSSSDPNFQNIPKRDEYAMRITRRAILPRPGHMLMEADFASLEVMISACYHKDPTMLKYLKTKGDMHLDMAKRIFLLDEMDRSLPSHAILRSAAKNGFVFPQFYGDYYVNNAISLCEWIKLPSEGRWKKGQGIQLPDGTPIADHFIANRIRSFDDFVEFIKGVEEHFWGKLFPVYANWRERWVRRYRKKAYLDMYTGFRVTGEMRRNQIINIPVQGSAFHCLLKTFIRVDEIMRKEKWRSRLIGQIHDSMVLDVDPDEFDRVRSVIEETVHDYLPSTWKWIIVPLEIEIETFGVDKPWVKEKGT